MGYYNGELQMASQTRVNGLAGSVGVLNGTTGTNVGASVKFYLITAKDAGTTAVDLRPLDDATNEAFELIMRALPSGILSYFATDSAAGTISVVVDGHAAPSAAALQVTLRALGATAGPTGGTTVDLTGTTVADGTSFTVA